MDDLPAAEPSRPPLKVVNSQVPGGVVCALTGDLDMDTRPAAEAELLRAVDSEAEVVCVDMREVQFCGSSGLNMLLTARTRAEQAHVRFAPIAPTDQTMRLLEVTGADTVFLIYPHYELAVDDLADH